MRRAAQKTKRTLAVFTLALASCRGPIQALTPTPEVVPLRFVSTSGTAPLLRSLTSSYQREDALVAFVDQKDLGMSVQQVLNQPHSSNTPLPPPTYALTTYYDPDLDLWAAPLGYDAIAVISHPDLELDMLSANDLRAVFSGTVTRWSRISSQPGEIIVVSRDPSSATYKVFQEFVMGSRQVTYNARLATNSEAMLDIVATTPGAIGYINMSLLNDAVDAVPVAATRTDRPTLPTRQTVANRIYPLRMTVLVVGPRPPTPGDGYYEFIHWAQSEGQAVIGEYIVPLTRDR